VCPAGKELRFDRPHSTERSLRYRARAKDCNHCPLKAQCTTSKQGRSLCRSVGEACLERVRGYQPTAAYKKALRKRQVWVEPLFAEGKEWHGMRRFRLRRLWRVNCEALMRAAGQNLKRLLKQRGWWWMTLHSLKNGSFFTRRLTQLTQESCSDPSTLLMSFNRGVFQQAGAWTLYNLSELRDRAEAEV
jgi:Transposase DDE domain